LERYFGKDRPVTRHKTPSAKKQGESPGFYPIFAPLILLGMTRVFTWDDAFFFWNTDDTDDADFILCLRHNLMFGVSEYHLK
jgi:hypothetical protein